MKYILVPIWRTFLMLGIIFIAYPLCFIMCILEAVWCFETEFWQEMKTDAKKGFYISYEDSEVVKVYRTPIDYIMNRYTIIKQS